MQQPFINKITNDSQVLGGILLVVQPPIIFGSSSDSGYTDEVTLQ